MKQTIMQQSNAVLDVPVLANASQLVSTAFSMFREAEQISFTRKYDPASIVIPGYRHAVLRYRNTDGKSNKVAQMVTVPQVVIPDDVVVFDDSETGKKCKALFLSMIEDAEDMVIRNLIDEKQASNIGWTLVGFENAIAYLTAERVSSRLTKEQIENWFVIAGKQFCDTRAAQICEAKSITDPAEVTKQQAGTLNAYKERMMKLAAPVPNLGTNEATALKNMLLASKLDDDMAKVLLAKLEQVLNPKVVESGDL